MAYRMIHYTDFSQLDEWKAREVAKLFGMAGVVPSGNGGHIIDKMQGLSLVVAEKQSSGNFEGFMLVKCCDKSEMEIRRIFDAGNPYAYGEYIKYAKELAQKNKVQKLAVYARDEHLKSVCKESGLFFNQFSYEFDNEVVFKAYADKMINNVGRILAFLEEKVSSGRVHSYFMKYYAERPKAFIKYLEKETNLNVSTYLNSPNFFGALLLREEMNHSGVATVDLKRALREKKTNPSIIIDLKNKCPKTMEKHEYDLKDLYKIMDACNMAKLDKRYIKKDEENHN